MNEEQLRQTLRNIAATIRSAQANPYWSIPSAINDLADLAEEAAQEPCECMACELGQPEICTKTLHGGPIPR